MTRRIPGALVTLLACTVGPAPVAAQPLGTFRWQLQPFCNVVTLAVTQNGAIYRLEGTDDQCGNGADAASVTGTAFPNPDGTIGFGLNVVTTPGGRPLHVDAEIAIGTFSGTWRDSAGASGTFGLTPGAGSGGNPRPLPSAVPATIVLRPDGGVVAGGAQDVGTIPATGPGNRMMWYPGKAAFRAGEAVLGGWDDANIGYGSVALGNGPIASGFSSTATGLETVASGLGSTAFGHTTRATGDTSIAMGRSTTASGFFSTATGQNTTASGTASTSMGTSTRAEDGSSVAMGRFSVASGPQALAGGDSSVASARNALAFGASSQAIGGNSVALGTRAVADEGSFVFADGASSGAFGSGLNQFFVRASGGAAFFSNATSTTGVRLATGGSQWLTISDVSTKHRFRELDGDDVLARIAAMPVTEWSYKAQDDAVRHIGPTAQDFHAAFGLGEDPLRIGTLDADGVALAAVRALEARTRHLPERATSLESENARLRATVEDLRARVAALMDDNTAVRDRVERLERLLTKH
ncbi:MAG: tail fiber domain-containing protein [Vicinamibacterales bacterium]